MKHLLWLSFLIGPTFAAAASPVVLSPTNVPQYRLAADAARKSLPNAIVVDPASPQAAAELAQAPVVLAVGQKALSIARDANPSGSVVFCMVLGVSRSMLDSRVTGVPLEADPTSTLAEIRDVAPSARKIGVIYNPKTSEIVIAEATRAARSLGLELVLKAVSQPTEVKDAAAGLAGSVDLIWVPPNPQLISKEMFSYLLAFAAERKIPLVGFLDTFTKDGALASVSPNYSAIGELAGKMAAEALSSRRAPPLQFAHGDLTINLRTAEALGIDVPQKALGEATQSYR